MERDPLSADACRNKADDGVPEAVRAWREVARLRQWKAEADEVLAAWEGVWMIAGQPWRRGETQAQAVAREVQHLRSQNAAWMNGVADAVEPLGYDRQAACGPADLLPGLIDLVELLADAWERVDELETRLERHPATTGARALLDPGPLGTVSHPVIPQPGSNLCVCGEWDDAAVHQVDP